MEWAAMHRPLEPPPGYEKYHSYEEVFPGLRYKLKKIESWSDLTSSFQNAWRLYRHDFVPDPEITKFEEAMDIDAREKREKAIENALKTGENMATKGVETAKGVADNLAAEFEDRRPMMERVARDRISVLRDAVHEFAEGYQESVSGEKTLWGEVPYDEDIVRDDNLPVRYKVEREGE